MHEKRAWLWAVAAGLLSPCHTVPLVLALVATSPFSRFRGVLTAVMVLAFFGLWRGRYSPTDLAAKGEPRSEFR